MLGFAYYVFLKMSLAEVEEESIRQFSISFRRPFFMLMLLLVFQGFHFTTNCGTCQRKSEKCSNADSPEKTDIPGSWFAIQVAIQVAR